MRAKAWVARIGTVALVAVACSAGGLLDVCREDTFLTMSPLDLGDIDFIRPLGGLNPPGHVFPTDHIYFYMHRDAAGVPYTVPLYAPGDLTVTMVSASQHVNAGFTDFALELTPCQDVTVVFGHVTSLDPNVFGDTSAFSGWTLSNEYTTGGETYRLWRKAVSIPVAAGQYLGTTGGRRGQYALDLGVYDERKPAEAVANVSRWIQSRALTAVCPFDYYTNGPVQRALLELIEIDADIAGASRCFTVFQDVTGTARGCWFLEGTTNTYPEDPHLALVALNIRPSRYVFSVGTSVPGLTTGVYEFAIYQAGVLNRPFDLISADETTYGYALDGYLGTVIVTMPDDDTLWIEALPAGHRNSRTWQFSEDKTIFRR